MVRRPLTLPHDKGIKPIDLMWYDVTGEEDGIEYQILDTSNDTHIKAGPSSRTCLMVAFLQLVFLPTACGKPGLYPDALSEEQQSMHGVPGPGRL